MSDPTPGFGIMVLGRRDHAEFLTPEEIATLLKLPVRTVHEWLRTKKLPGFKPGNGKLWRVTAGDFERWTREQKEEDKPKSRPKPTTTVDVRIRERRAK